MDDELKRVMLVSLVGTIGVMWVVGGIALVLAGFQAHWALGWLALFIWIWGCGVAALYFNLQRFFN